MQRMLAKRRPTIGVFTHHCKTPGDTYFQNGLYDAALKRDANMIIFAADSLEMLGQPMQMLLFPLASTERIDGWIISSEFSPDTLTGMQIKDFISSFNNLPVVSVNTPIDGVPRIISDNYSGMRDQLIHLIREHHYRKIGFIRGPKDSSKVHDSYRAYIDVLREFGLEKENHNVVADELTYFGGIKAVRALDENGILLKLQALVTCNTELMDGAYRELKSLGYKIPDDIALVGFADGEAPNHWAHPMTIVTPNFYEQGISAVEALWELMKGQNISSVLRVPARCIAGDSCGCTAEYRLANSEVNKISKEDDGIETKLLEEIAQVLNLSEEKRRSFESVKRLLAALRRDLFAEKDAETFMEVLQQILEAECYQSISLQPWALTVGIIHRWFVKELVDQRRVKRLGTLLQKAQIKIASQTLEQERAKRIELEGALMDLRRFFAKTHGFSELDRLVEYMSAEIPRFGIEDCIIALFEAPFRIKDGMDRSLVNDGRLSMAVQTEQTITLRERQIVPIRPMTPKVAFPKERYVRVVQPLISRGEYFGYMVSGFGNGPSVITDLFREEMGRAICANIALGRQLKYERSKNYGLMMREANSLT